MIIIWGLRVVWSTIATGVFHCRRCGGDRNYRHRGGRRFFTLFFIPIIPLNKVGEHVQCTTCRTRYVMDVLSLPTAEQMQTALPAGMRAAATAVLRAGDPASPAARQRAVTVIAGAGAQGYTDADLDPDMARPAEAVRGALGRVAQQLTADAREWFLAEIVRVALADGPLTGPERQTVQAVSADLGMTPAQAIGVVTMIEQGAPRP